MKEPDNNTQTPGNMPRQAATTISFILLLGLMIGIAQLAGLSGNAKKKSKAFGTKIATVAGAPVPDYTSTALVKKSFTAAEGETIRMAGSARLRLSAKSASPTQVVCGITYSRDADAAWTLGSPYDLAQLSNDRRATKISMERSFIAPADDTYRAEYRCHIAAPEAGGKVRAKGSLKIKRGLPEGAATPVDA